MANQSIIYQQWQRRLKDLLSQSDGKSSHYWYREIRIRVLRYLLSRYANHEILSEPDTSSLHSPRPVIIKPIRLAGTVTSSKFKSQADIRRLLSNINSANREYAGRPHPFRFFV